MSVETARVGDRALSPALQLSGRPRRHAGGTQGRRGSRAQRTFWYLVCAVLAAFALGPVVVIVFNSLKSEVAATNSPLSLPWHPMWSNFATAWDTGGMGTGFLNSLLYVSVTVVLVCAIAVVSAYALVRMRVRFSAGVSVYLIVATGLPIQAFLVPLFYLWTHLHLYDTKAGLVIIYVATATPFAVLLLRSYLAQVPVEYVEAARVDGAGEYRIARTVVAPLLWPGVIAVALVTGVGVYNDFIFAATFLQSAANYPVGLSFYTFQESNGLNYALTAAGGVLVTAPIFVLFFLIQRRFVEGLSATGLRG